MSRYQRQTMLPEVGPQGEQRLAQARVLVVGAGGLGSVILPLLAGAGVGYLRIYDADKVELHNLHRQTLFSMNDLHLPKVVCASRALSKLNPECQVEAVSQRLCGSNLADALADIDLVIDAADNFAVTYQLSDACYPLSLPLISASALGRQGYLGGFCATAPSYRAVFPSLPKAAANCNTAGVMGPAVSTLGAMQAQMALSVLLELSPSPLGCVVNCDFVRWHFSQFRFDGAPEPSEPVVPFIDSGMLDARDCIVELRSDEEAPLSVAASVIRLLPRQMADWQPPADRRIVLVCASGIRAARAASELEQRGYRQLAILPADHSQG